MAIVVPLRESTKSIPISAMLLLGGCVMPLAAQESERIVVHQVGGFDTNVWTGGKRLGIVVDGKYGYVGGDQFYVFDLSWPRYPRTLGSLRLSAASRDVAIRGDYAFVAADNAGLRVIDISDPGDPHEAGLLELPGDARCIAVSGNMAYVGDPGNGADQEAGAVRLVDVSHPRQPKLVGSFEYPSVVMDIEVGDKFVYVGDRNGRLLVADLSNPSEPILVGEARGLREVTGVKLAGRFVHVSDNDSAYHIVDVSDPANPQKVATVHCDGLGRLPVATTQPDGGRTIVRLPAPGFGSDVHPDGKFAWVTGVTGRVALIDHSDKTNPQVVALFDTRLRAYGVTVRDELAYINCDQGRLVVLQRAAGDEEVAAAARGFVASFTQPSQIKTTVASLVDIGPDAIPALLPAMRGRESVVRMYAAHALSFIQPHEIDIECTTAAWVSAIGNRRGGQYHGGPINYVRRVVIDLRFPESSRAAIGDALVSQLADEKDDIHKVAKETLFTISQHSDMSRRLVLSCLRKVRNSQAATLRDNAAALEREIVDKIDKRKDR